MNELGRPIRDQVRAAVKATRGSRSANVAAAINVGEDGHSTSVYSDNDVTVVTRDGQTHVIRHRDDGDRDPLSDRS